jgi:dephospho-CoA kinase
MSAAEALARIKTQVDAAERISVADVVIDNDGSHDELVAQVDRLWTTVRKLSAAPPTVDP